MEINHIWSRKSLSILLQSEAAECGLACLGMIANFYGHDFSLPGLRSRNPVSSRGLSLSDLMEIADDLDLEASPYKVELESLSDLEMPCILHWDLNHYVVCEKANEHVAIIYDPAFGVKVMRYKEISAHFTGIALTLKPKPDFQPTQHRPKLKFWTLVQKIRGIKKSFATAGILSVFILSLTMIMPYFSMIIVDHIIITKDMNLLTILGVAFCFAVVIDAFGRYLRNYFVLHLGSQFFQQLSRHIGHHLLHLPLAFFEKRRAGDILSRLESLEYIRHVVSEEVIAAAIDGFLALLSLIMMFFLAPKLAAIVFLLSVIFLVVRIATYPAFYQASEEKLVAQSKADSTILESLRTIQAVKLYRGEEERLALWMRHNNQSLNAQNRAQMVEISIHSLGHLIYGLEEVFVLWVSGMLVIHGQMSVGLLIAFLSYKHQFVRVFQSLTEKIFEMKLISLHMDRLSELLLERPEKITRGRKSLEIDGSLRIKKLSFAYNPREPLLFENIDFQIDPGESVVIVGPSGSGKTTLIKVLLGLLQPSSGHIYAGRYLLENIMEDYRRQVATVMQDDRLISGSIADNIALFDPKPDFDWIRSCAERASIHQDISEMTMGYQTLVSDFSPLLSGGQVQRILLARALYSRPKILFLDEATSALDVQMERKIADAIRELPMTKIMIAHRPETIARAGRILLLKDQQVIPTELQKVPGF